MPRTLGVAALGAWLALATARGRYWSTAVRLPPRAGEPAASDPGVVAVVPARDEASVLGRTLPALLAQAGGLLGGVIVVDDDSSDATAATARACGAQVVSGIPPPAGWAGKVWALEQGVRAAAAQAPEAYLLVDADVLLAPDALARLVQVAGERRADLVSVMARLDVEGAWARLLVPAFVWFFALLYPFRWVNRPGSRTAAAAGGCLLVRRDALQRAGGFAALRGELIDDVALARAVKRSGGRLWLGLASDVVSLRSYRHLADVWRMVARSAYVQLRCSSPLLVVTLAGLGLLFAAPVLGGWPGLSAYAVMTVVYLPIVRFYGLPAPWALTLPLAGALYGAMTAHSALIHHRGGGAAWKGRRYGRRQRADGCLGQAS